MSAESDVRFIESLRISLDSDPAIAGLDIKKVQAGEIRLLCPRGHFIANLAVIVFDDDIGVLLRPRGADKQHFGDVFNDPNHGFRFDDQSRDTLRARVRCTREKCPYDGVFSYDALARDVVTGVVRGHTEYRLTN